MSSRKKIVLIILALFLIAATGILLSYALRLIDVGTAYKAKMLCSEVFVAGRSADAVLAELATDDLASLRFFDTTIDRIAKKTAANLFGIAENNARYRENLGCALMTNCEAPPLSITEEKKLHRTDLALKSDELDNPRLSAVINEAFTEPDPEHPRRTRGIVVLHKGHIVAERYASNIGPDTPLLGWSMTKSVMNALVGILVREGHLELDTPVAMPHWMATDDPRQNITVEHLLHMSSGLAFNESKTDPLSDVIHMLLKEGDMAAFAAGQSLEAEPGSRWQYSSGTTNILSGFLRQTLGDQAYHRFPREALFKPLGMDRTIIEADASGTFVGSSFMYATAREWARFGLLYLQDGIWEGERILPEGWVQYTKRPAPSDPEASYGAHFWLRIPEEFRGAENALPNDAYHAIGHEGQFITIIPSHETVVVRLGKTRYPQSWQHDVFVRDVLAALPQDSP